MKCNQEFILESTGGTLLSGSADVQYEGLSIDSRRIGPGDLFVAIRGENFDGHDFVMQAVENGASGALVESSGQYESSGKEFSTIKVDSTVKALGRIANAWRKSFKKLKVVCITGSNGKTTTKEMASNILSMKKEVLKSTGNENNQIGLPLTLLKLNSNHNICVAELGMNDFGEISYLAEIAEPDIGAITNIGRAHLEKLITLEGVARAKAELVQNFDDTKTFIVNRDDPFITAISENINSKKVTYSIEDTGCDLYAQNIETDGLESIAFDLHIQQKPVSVRIRGMGMHNVMNALCASAISHALGFSPEEIQAGLENYSPVYMRLEIIEAPQGFNIINDSYNANPDSMSKALFELSKLKNNNKLIAVLGDMLELGSSSAEEHRKIGNYINELNLDYVITYGDNTKFINQELRPGIEGVHVDSHQQAAQLLIEKAGEKDFVLLKGSRGMKMENTIKFLY